MFDVGLSCLWDSSKGKMQHISVHCVVHNDILSNIDCTLNTLVMQELVQESVAHAWLLWHVCVMYYYFARMCMYMYESVDCRWQCTREP